MSIEEQISFGLVLRSTTERGQAQLGIQKDSFSWGGYYGTTYWADPKERLVLSSFHATVSIKPWGNSEQIQGDGISDAD